MLKDGGNFTYESFKAGKSVMFIAIDRMFICSGYAGVGSVVVVVVVDVEATVLEFVCPLSVDASFDVMFIRPSY